ncbi:MAG: glyceraldehyde 3-phosphate dehydrogenase [Flavobacteriales bacterium]|jgi:glyceraldehyde 3-phosphate dehydrogenase
MTMRHLANMSDVEVVGINDLGDNKTLAHLFSVDSSQGRFDGAVTTGGDWMEVNGKRITMISEREPAKLPWAALQVDVVLECTGRFRTKESASDHLLAGAKGVVISAPAKGDIPFVVLGVNDEVLDSKPTIVSNASCTTNCLAPMVKILDEAFGVEKGFITTIHAYTGDQNLQDAPHSDLRRARAAAVSIIPTTTGAASAVSKVLPHLAGKLDGVAVRVPIPAGSVTDLVVNLGRDVTLEEVNAAMKAAADGPMKGILEYSEMPLVSIDIVGNTHSCIYDSGMTIVSGNMVKVFGWYDNEAGYAARLADLVKKLNS